MQQDSKTISMQELSVETLLEQRGREAELEQELHGLLRTVEVLKHKVEIESTAKSTAMLTTSHLHQNASLPEPPEEQTQKIDKLETSVAELHRELQRRESQHDEIIANTLTKLNSRRGSLENVAGSVEGHDNDT